MHWFPQKGSSSVVGRITLIEVIDAAASNERGKPVWKRVPALETKIAGSSDVSIQRIKAGNENELRQMYPGAFSAWETGGADAEAEPEEAPSGGTPLTRLEGLPKRRARMLEDMGVLSVEHLAALSDGDLGNLGPGMLALRKKAQDYLATAE